MGRSYRGSNNKQALKYANKKNTSVEIIKIVIVTILIFTIGGVAIIFLGDIASRFEDSMTRQAEYEAEETERVLTPHVAPTRPGASATDPTEYLQPELTGISYVSAGGQLELPIYGATGWAATSLTMRTASGGGGSAVANISPGQGFRILAREGNFWYVYVVDRYTGWIDHRGAFINLPDVLPSIIYQNTNASASVKVSLGLDIPGVTGQQLYNAGGFNPRLDRYEYIVPGLYSLARALFVAQQEAERTGDSIIMNEAFRPTTAQTATRNGLTRLIQDNNQVHQAINAGPWNMGWFISTGVSNHQRGSAVDVSLASVNNYIYHQTGDFIFRRNHNFREYFMQTDIHELSPLAAIVQNPRNISAAELLAGTVTLAENVTQGTRQLQQLLATAGFTPLASEWWHFDHPPSTSIAQSAGINGNFVTETIYSVPPIIN